MQATIVMPCFNEQHRLRPAELLALVGAPGVHLLLVDDASTDDTRAVIDRLHAQAPSRIEVMRLDVNRGKAEAVRLGLQRALATGAPLTGYLDADLSTPPRELLRLIEIARARDVQVVMGARVARLGAHIERRPLRHYLGRVFATAASLILDVPVYDTQCGAKVLRASPALRAALARPFRSSWAFDVELIGRLLAGDAVVAPLRADDFVEEPLQEWVDVAGSHLRPRHLLGAAVDLAWIAVDLRARGALRSRRAGGEGDS